MRAASTRNAVLSAGNIYDCVYSVSVYCNYSYVGDRRLTRLSVSKKCKSSSFIFIRWLQLEGNAPVIEKAQLVDTDSLVLWARKMSLLL